MSVLRRVFSQIQYLALSASTFFVIVSVALLAPNASVIKTYLTASTLSVLEKISFIGALYQSFITNHSWYSRIALILIALLCSTYISLLLYYVKTRRVQSRDARLHIGSIGGVIAGVLGIGCAACGSIILTSILTLFGGSGLLLLLPLHGAEISILSIGLLLWVNYFLIQKIHTPRTC
jgi:hypothetical protein